jgi:hypothetical protein
MKKNTLLALLALVALCATGCFRKFKMKMTDFPNHDAPNAPHLGRVALLAEGVYVLKLCESRDKYENVWLKTARCCPDEPLDGKSPTLRKTAYLIFLDDHRLIYHSEERLRVVKSLKERKKVVESFEIIKGKDFRKERMQGYYTLQPEGENLRIKAELEKNERETVLLDLSLNSDGSLISLENIEYQEETLFAKKSDRVRTPHSINSVFQTTLDFKLERTKDIKFTFDGKPFVRVEADPATKTRRYLGPGGQVAATEDCSSNKGIKSW